MRTKLGIVKGALDDQVAGYTLTVQDFVDAQQAANSLLATLDALRDISLRPHLEKSNTSLGQLLDYELPTNLSLEFSRESADTETFLIHLSLTRAAIKLVLAYINSRLQRFPNPCDQPLSSIRLLAKRNKLIFVFSQDKPYDLEHLESCKTLSDIAELDQHMSALGLIAVEAVMALNDGSSSCHFSTNHCLEIILEFPTSELAN